MSQSKLTFEKEADKVLRVEYGRSRSQIQSSNSKFKTHFTQLQFNKSKDPPSLLVEYPLWPGSQGEWGELWQGKGDNLRGMKGLLQLRSRRREHQNLSRRGPVEDCGPKGKEGRPGRPSNGAAAVYLLLRQL